MWPNHALQRTRPSRRGFISSLSWAGSLSLGRSAGEKMESNPRVIEFLMGLSEDERRVIAPLSKMALRVAPDIREGVKWNALCYFKGDRAFVGVMPYKKYVSVIFDLGVELDDPHKVLEGKGHSMRHIKVHSFDDLEKKHVGSYIKQSYKLEEEID
jgi:hypothetical protein